MSKSYKIKAYESLITGFVGAILDLQSVNIDDSVTAQFPPNSTYQRLRGGPTAFRIIGRDLLAYVIGPILKTDITTRGNVRIDNTSQQSLDNLLQQHQEKNTEDMQGKAGAIEQLESYFSQMVQAKQSTDPNAYAAFRDALEQVLNFVHLSVYQNHEPLGTIRVARSFAQSDLAALYNSIEQTTKALRHDVTYLQGIDASQTPDEDALKAGLEIMKGALTKLENGLRGAKRFGISRPEGALMIRDMSPTPPDLDIDVITQALYYQQ